MNTYNWKIIKKQYINEHAETGVDVKTFCVRNGLNYSTARKHLNNKLLGKEQNTEHEQEPKNTEQNKNTASRSAKNNNANVRKSKRQPTKSADSPKQSNRGGKRNGSGAPKGNKNAFVHGLMSRAFGDLVKYSHQVDDEFKLEVHKLASIQALDHFVRYKDELEQFLEALPEDKAPTELEQETIDRLERRIESSFNKVTYHTGKLEALETSMANRRYTNRSTSKVIAQTTHVEVDTNLKRKGIGLAEANTKKATAQTELTMHELDMKQREGLGDDDDLGMLLDEIQDTTDDEILERFKARGGELTEDE
ncbi:hypothetical protein [Photobacterium sanguinicancri]|uniref:hypothetical protein n=1 Tax=Photobacterium sanguinicancri TaxID=875932 RepID=UPI003D12AF7D